MVINRNNVVDIVRKCSLNADKDYGQNFLLEEDICKKIVDGLEIQPNDNVLEIGPGLGSLTHFITQYDNPVTLVDIDIRMINFLKIHYGNLTNVSLICNDIRKEDVSTYTKVIANLPYNITTELIVFLLQKAKQCKKLVLMCQSETFLHFSDIGGKEYGPTSVLIHLLGDIKRLFNVKAGSFYPVPKCNSTVFTIEIDQNLSDLEKDNIINVYSFVKQLFINRRKTILNNLNHITGNSCLSKTILENCEIMETKRPEEIKPSQFVALFNEYNKINGK